MEQVYPYPHGLLKHPRFQPHFTPTSSSWLNLAERFFAEITAKLLRRGVHRSVTALEKDIRDWIKQWNTNPQALRMDPHSRSDPRVPSRLLSAN